MIPSPSSPPVRPRRVDLRRPTGGADVIVAVVLALAAVCSMVLVPVGTISRSPVFVVTAGRRVYAVPPGTTLDRFLRVTGREPRAGNLVAVDHSILRRGVRPGYVTVNGRRVTGNPTLATGDRIAVHNGRNVREPLVREVFRIPGGMKGNPEFYLGTAPAEEIVVRGALSGKVLRTTYQAIGPESQPPAIALTFDDGPWPNSTLKILRVLRRYHVRATFCVIGYLAQRYPDLVRREKAAGMEICNHSWNHPLNPPLARLSKSAVRKQIARADGVLGSLGITPTLFRPPGGSYDAAVIKVARSLGQRIAMWSIDPRDWVPGTTAKQIAHRVLAAARPGYIVDLHDGGGDRTATLKALPKIIKGIRKMGLRFAVM